MENQEVVIEKLVGIVEQLVEEVTHLVARVSKIESYAAGENHVQYLRDEVQSLRE